MPRTAKAAGGPAAAGKAPINPTARVAKNSLVQIAGGVFNKILGVALVLYAARQLGIENFGVFSYVLSVFGIFYLLPDFGLGTITTRDLARDSGEDSRYLGNIILIRMALSLIASLGMVAAVTLLRQPASVVHLALIAALSMFFTSNVDTCSAIFFAHQRMEIPSLVSVVVTTLRVGVSLGALAAGAGLFVLICVFTLASAIQFALLYGMLLSTTRPVFYVDWAFWKTLLREAYPLALAGMFSAVYFRIDTILLATLVGQKAVGLYNAAYRLLEFTLIFPGYYGGAVFPVISASYRTSPQRFQLIYRRSVKYMLVASVPIAFGTAAIAPSIIEALYGNLYLGSIPVLPILMWTLVLICVNSLNAPYMITIGRQRAVTALTAVGMTVNILLNLFAIPRYGILGAAWVTLASEVLTIAMFLIVLAKPLSLKLGMLRHAVRPALAGGLMYAALRLIPQWDLGFQILVGAALYILLLLVLRVFDEVDQELFGRVLRPTWTGSLRLS